MNQHARRPATTMKMFGKTYTRQQVAEAVHQGVRQYTGSDGRSHCRLYALGGFMLLGHMGIEAHIQCGSLNVQPDPDDPTLWITMDPASGILGEFHCWLASPDRQLMPGGNFVSSGSIIDFSTRHLSRYVEDGGAGTWRREQPPSYIWADFSEVPKWYEVRSQEEPCRKVGSSITEQEMRGLGRPMLLALKSGACNPRR